MFRMIVGPMMSGKSDILIRYIIRAKIAYKNLLVFTPTLNTRDKEEIKSRTGMTYEVLKIRNPSEILTFVDEHHCELIFIDEVQFFDKDILRVVNELIEKDVNIIASGLDLDFRGEPFGQVPQLLAIANHVDKLTSVCNLCRSEYACRTQRLIHGKIAPYDSPQYLVGDIDDCLSTSNDCLSTSNDCLSTSNDCLSTSNDCLSTSNDCLSHLYSYEPRCLNCFVKPVR